MLDSRPSSSNSTWLRRIQRFFSIEEHPHGRILWPLFLVSFCSLYIEILLIRWIATEVRIFAYFQNLALIACFLGFGLGCYRAAQTKIDHFEATALSLLVVLAGIPLKAWKTMLENVSSALAL